MTTIYTCTEPKEAWNLVSHYLGNRLLVINLSKDEDTISRVRTELIGSLYVLIRRMDAHGHHSDAAKIQQILDMVTGQDVTRAGVIKAIHEKNRELNVFRAKYHVEGNSLCL